MWIRGPLPLYPNLCRVIEGLRRLSCLPEAVSCFEWSFGWKRGLRQRTGRMACPHTSPPPRFFLGRPENQAAPAPPPTRPGAPQEEGELCLPSLFTHTWAHKDTSNELRGWSKCQTLGSGGVGNGGSKGKRPHVLPVPMSWCPLRKTRSLTFHPPNEPQQSFSQKVSLLHPCPTPTVSPQQPECCFYLVNFPVKHLRHISPVAGSLHGGTRWPHSLVTCPCNPLSVD